MKGVLTTSKEHNHCQTMASEQVGERIRTKCSFLSPYYLLPFTRPNGKQECRVPLKIKISDLKEGGKWKRIENLSVGKWSTTKYPHFTYYHLWNWTLYFNTLTFFSQHLRHFSNRSLETEACQIETSLKKIKSFYGKRH